MRNVDAILDDLLENVALNPMPFLVFKFQLSHKDLIDAEQLINELENLLTDESTDEDNSSVKKHAKDITELCALARSHIQLSSLWLSNNDTEDSIHLTQFNPGKEPSNHKLAVLFNQLIAAIYNLRGILCCEAKIQIDTFPDPLMYAEYAFDRAYEFAPKDSFAEKTVSANMLTLLGDRLDPSEISDICAELLSFTKIYGKIKLDQANRLVTANALSPQKKIMFACICDSLATSSISDLDSAQKYHLQQQAFMLWKECHLISYNWAKLLYDREESTMEEVCFALEVYRKLLTASETLELLIHNMLALQKLASMQYNLFTEFEDQSMELEGKPTRFAVHVQETQKILFSLHNSKEIAKEALHKQHFSAPSNEFEQFTTSILKVEAFINTVKYPVHAILNPGQYVVQPTGFIPTFRNYIQKNKYMFASAIGVLCGLATYGYSQMSDEQKQKMSLGW